MLTGLGWGRTRCDNFARDLFAKQDCRGTTSVQDIRWAYFAFLQSRKCFSQYRDYKIITRAMLCAEGFVADARQQDSCQGDSGGPLIKHSGLPPQQLLGIQYAPRLHFQRSSSGRCLMGLWLRQGRPAWRVWPHRHCASLDHGQTEGEPLGMRITCRCEKKRLQPPVGRHPFRACLLSYHQYKPTLLLAGWGGLLG